MRGSFCLLVLVFLARVVSGSDLDSTNPEARYRTIKTNIVPGVTEVTIIDRLEGSAKRNLVVGQVEFPIEFDDHYSISSGAIVESDVFLLVRGNYGFFAARLCKDGALDFVSAMPELQRKNICSFSVQMREHGSLTATVEYAESGRDCCAEGECESASLVRDAPYGGIFYCEPALGSD